MQASHRIARILGPVLCVVGLGMLINGPVYRQIATQFFAGYPFIYFSGVLLLIAGLCILNSHNIWTRDWRGLITAVGLVFTGAGVFRVLAPPFAVFIGGALVANEYFFALTGIVFLVLGGFIAFKGYMAESRDLQQEAKQ